MWILLAALTVAPQPTSLFAGTAAADITPPAIGTPLGGYRERAGPSTGVHDRLAARVLVLKSEEQSVAFVSVDLRSFVADRVRERVRKELGIRHVLVSSSHTHSGPLTWEDRGAWYAETEDKLVTAIGEAAQKLLPARIAVGTGSVYLGHNRRRIGPDGRAAMLWRNAERIPTSPVDPTVTVLRVDDTAGKTLAIAAHYACHPSVLGTDNRQISADYPGTLRSDVEEVFPGAVLLFWQGAAGDINPYMDKQPVASGGFEEAARMGKALAAEVIRVAGRLTPTDLGGPLRVRGEVVELGHRWDVTKTIRAGMSTILLGSRLALVALPGEPFVNHQITLSAKSEIRPSLLLGYSSGEGGEWVGYLPTIEAAVSGGYGAGWNTNVEVGGGEKLIDRAVVRILEMTGRLTDTPR